MSHDLLAADVIIIVQNNLDLFDEQYNLSSSSVSCFMGILRYTYRLYTQIDDYIIIHT